MKTLFPKLLVGAALCVSLTVFSAEPPVQVVKFAGLPPVVQEAIKAEVAGGKIQQIAKHPEIGYLAFEVDYLKGTLARSFTVSSLGNILDREIAFTDAPAPAQKTIQKLAAGGKLSTVTWIFNEGEIFYFAEIEKAGKKLAYSIDGAGKLLSTQVTLAELDADVQKTIKEKVPEADVLDIDQTEDKDGVTFDVTYFQKGRGKRSFTVDEDGDLISEQLSRADVSQAVQNTIKEKVGKDRFKRLDKVVEDDPPYYQVEVIRNGKREAFKVAMNGKFMGAAE